MPIRSQDRIKTPKRSSLGPLAWIAAAIAVPYALFVASLSNDFYALTSPPDWSAHVVLRKVFSVGAFALVGFLIARAVRACGRPLSRRTVVLLGASYSGAIEVAQYLNGSQEGTWWNLFDVACGALGGAIAARLPRCSTPPRRPSAPIARFERSSNARKYKISSRIARTEIPDGERRQKSNRPSS